jgi:hypothetical protein
MLLPLDAGLVGICARSELTAAIEIATATMVLRIGCFMM